jgi:hypothetical protein
LGETSVVPALIAVQNRQDTGETFLEEGNARMRVSRVRQGESDFEITNPRQAGRTVATGLLRYSASAIDFAVQDESGQEVKLNVKKKRGHGNLLIQLSAGGASVSLRFDGEKALELAQRANRLLENGHNKEVVELAPEILATITSFERYRDFVRGEVSRSHGLAVLADLLVKAEGKDTSEAVSLLGSICAFLAPSIHFTARATRPRVVKTSYTAQVDQMCLIDCIAFFSANVGTCSAIWDVGDAMWWACLAVDGALTAWCMSLCGGMAN